MRQDPSEVANRVARFVGVEPWFTKTQIEDSGFVEVNDLLEVDVTRPDMHSAVSKLTEFYRPHMDDLYELLDIL